MLTALNCCCLFAAEASAVAAVAAAPPSRSFHSGAVTMLTRPDGFVQLQGQALRHIRCASAARSAGRALGSGFSQLEQAP